MKRERALGCMKPERALGWGLGRVAHLVHTDIVTVGPEGVVVSFLPCLSSCLRDGLPVLSRPVKQIAISRHEVTVYVIIAY